MTVAPFGGENSRQAKLAGIDVPESLVRAAAACEPAVYAIEKPGAAPHALPAATLIAPLAVLHVLRAGVRGNFEQRPIRRRQSRVTRTPLVTPWARFLPSFDLAAASALAELLGAKLCRACHSLATMKR